MISFSEAAELVRDLPEVEISSSYRTIRRLTPLCSRLSTRTVASNWTYGFWATICGAESGCLRGDEEDVGFDGARLLVRGRYGPVPTHDDAPIGPGRCGGIREPRLDEAFHSQLWL